MNIRFAALIFFTPALWAQSYTTSTIAGGRLPVQPAQATSVSVGYTAGLARDAAGDLYVANPDLNVIFKVTTAGVATVFAGTGIAGYSGDGGAATNADLNFPGNISIDASGNLYIVDEVNNAIRKVSTAGTITTVAGNGTSGYLGDGGPAVQAELNYPGGVAVDASGNIYVADTGNNVVRVISTGGTINTFAGNSNPGYSGDGGPATAASLYYPLGLAFDSWGNLYIADYENSVIRKVSTGGTISTFAGNGSPGYSGNGGPAVSAELSYSEGVSVDTSGNVYIADTGNAVIREVAGNGIISTVAGNGAFAYSGDGGQAISAALDYPETVLAGSSGAFSIGDSQNYRVRQVASSGIITTVAGNGDDNYGGDGGPATAALLATPSAVAVSSSGTVFVADPGNNRIRQITSAGVITTIAGNGTAGYSGDNGPATAAQLNYPSGVAVDTQGNLYVADTYNFVIRKIDTSGVITTFAGNGSDSYFGDGGPATQAAMSYPEGLALDSTGNLFIADTYNNVVREVITDGIIMTVAGSGVPSYSGDGGPAAAANLNSPYGVAVDARGNLYIADTYNSVIRMVNTAGVITTVPATNGQLNDPYGVAVDTSGNLFIADTYNNRIEKIAAGALSTIAGGVLGYSGDGGPGLDAELDSPEGVAVGPSGVIYVADTYNNAIRTLAACIPLASNANADSTAQTLSVPITASSSCSYSASNLPSWITSASSGVGSGNFQLTLQANTTGADRSATITINGLPVAVLQDFTATSFSDVTPGAYYFDAVNLLKNENVTAGCGANDYCPGDVVTRDEMAIFIVRTILGDGTFTYSPTPYFADVPSSYFAFPWIQKLYELGITAGCSVNPISYCPSGTVSRDEMAIFIIRARYGPATMFTWNPTPYFTDVPSSYYAFDWIQRMYQDSITAGCNAAPLEYCPGNPVTRGDMAIFLMRGGYNQLLPSTAPVISSISPATLTHGATGTFTVTGTNTAFQQGVTTLVFPATSGITVNSIAVMSGTTLQISLTAAADAAIGPVSIYEQTEPQEAVLPNGLTVQ